MFRLFLFVLVVNMSVGKALQDLGRFLDDCEERGTGICVELAEGGDSGGVGALTADVELELAMCPSAAESVPVSLRDATIDPDGTLQLTFESPDPVVPTTGHDVDVGATDATLNGDGTVTVTLSASVRVEGDDAGMESTTDGADDQGALPSTPLHDRGVPPFEDPELLAEVYESCDTFAEMTDELGMDVTPETVRRYMVDYDIHEPNSYDTGDDEPEEGARPRAALTDGIGLPDDVTVETLIETVKQSSTIYEVKRDIGVEHDDALEMLRELNLLDLVVGRLATEAERDISREEVVSRLRKASATQ